MAKAQRDPELLRAGERVVAAIDLPRIPEGTAGKVTFVEGFTWIRYWVRFANGETLGSIHRAKLARVDEWEDVKARRARGDDHPAEQAAPAAVDDEAVPVGASSGDGEATATGAASRVPAHLLERSKRRREELGH
jgi:hypothetical protein